VVIVAICLPNISMTDKTEFVNNLCTVVVEVMTIALILNKNVNDSVSMRKVIKMHNIVTVNMSLVKKIEFLNKIVSIYMYEQLKYYT